MWKRWHNTILLLTYFQSKSDLLINLQVVYVCAMCAGAKTSIQKYVGDNKTKLQKKSNRFYDDNIKILGA